jgi:ferredoxin-nitrite reductase
VSHPEALVVIGSGSAGTRVVQEILARDPDRYTITLFGAAPRGFAEFEDSLHDRLRLHAGVRAERIDRPARVVVGRPGSTTANGHSRSFVLEEPYDKLVLATGARPVVPSLEGTDKAGVLVFRTSQDTDRIAEHARMASRAVVLGGGLRGLEAARSLLSHGVEVTVVEDADHLLGHHLDPTDADLLKQKLEVMGVRVLLQKQAARMLGNGTVRGLEFQDGGTLEADLVVLPCASRPNVDIARDAGLVVPRAIVVDDQLRTSDPDIFAVGECVEHRGKLAGPGDFVEEQAKVLADVLTGVDPRASYTGDHQPLLGQILGAFARSAGKPKRNPVEITKQKKDGLDVLPDILRRAETGVWEEMTEDEKHLAKWYGLFFRKQTPGHFMLRLRLTCGFANARQFRVIADLSDQYGKGFCDLTTRQQIQLRWFGIRDVPEIWRRLEAVGLNSKQTGMDNVRGVCGCPVAGLSAHELFDASPVAREFTELLLGNREFTNLPRKFNVTITGCLENCCHTETQDIALVPAFRELGGQQVNGFNLLVGGKQGSGGYEPARPLDVFVRPEDAAGLCGHVVRIFRDHGSRETRTRARLAFLLQDRGEAWFRGELERRYGGRLHTAGTDTRKKHHVDHLGIHPQRSPHGHDGPQLHYAGLLVPVGRITTAQMRGLADLAERYGNGDLRVTVQQNVIVPNIPESRLGAFMEEPLLKELAFDPSPILRGLVACTGIDYCHFALIETKSWAVQVARELEKRTEGKKIAPLTTHWSGCPAGCGLHQVSTIGLQGCRSRVNGKVVDAAHVYVDGKSGPQPQLAKDLMYDVPCEQLADALEPLVKYLPR